MKHTKVCTRCNVEKEINKENFPTREGGRFRADCRDCYNAFRRENPTYAKHHMIGEAKRRAKKKGLACDLNKELYFPKVCPILGIDLKHGSTDWYNSPNIDRIDNNKGYLMDNVIVVSALANAIKNAATPDQILAVGEFYKKLYEERGIKYA